MMIRKFFAAILVLIFSFLLVPLLILQAFTSTFFNESRLTEKILPESYEPAIHFFAGQFARQPQEVKLFRERLREVLPRESYIELFSMAIRPFLGDRFPQKIDLKPLREKLASTIRPSRSEAKLIMHPKGATFSGPNIKENLLQQIPQELNFQSFKNPKVLLTIEALYSVKKFLPLFINIFGGILLAATALLIFSPFSRVLKWLGSAFFILALFVTLFLVSMDRLQTVLAQTPGFTPSQTELANFFIRQPLSQLTIWTFFLWATGVLLFGSGILLPSTGRTSKK
jgi:hypothetical protein